MFNRGGRHFQGPVEERSESELVKGARAHLRAKDLSMTVAFRELDGILIAKFEVARYGARIEEGYFRLSGKMPVW